MLGARTSLGEFFVHRAIEQGHPVCCGWPDVGDVFDWIVNCEGRNHLEPIGGPLAPDFNRQEQLLIGNVLPIYRLVDHLASSGHPPARVLSVASQTYRIAQTNTAIYCASKAALVHLSRAMARELAPRGWVINCLAPGKIEDTRMAELTDAQVLELRGWTAEEAETYALRNVPMRRFTNRAEVTEAMFGVLRLPPYINGACIDMTGGA